MVPRHESRSKAMRYIRKRDGRLTTELVSELPERGPGRCRYQLSPGCRARDGRIQGVTRDHVVPLYRRGKNHPDNIEFVCRECNQSKGALLLEEFVVLLAMEELCRNPSKRLIPSDCKKSKRIRRAYTVGRKKAKRKQRMGVQNEQA